MTEEDSVPTSFLEEEKPGKLTIHYDDNPTPVYVLTIL